jgi:Ca-activated chloride channel family protein
MGKQVRVGLCVLAVVMTFAGAPKVGFAQGWVEITPGLGSSLAVDKTRSEVRVTVDGRVARVEVSEWFLNGGGRVAEGHYLYPLPGEAVFQGFSLFQGDAELRGEIMDADQARRIYEEIVRRRADPALIELAGHGLLRARVFPIEPGEERKVTLRFTQVLERAGTALQFVYAGSVRSTQAVRDGVEALVGARSGSVETVFRIVAEDGDMFLEPFSPTHALEITRRAGRLSVEVDEELVGRLSLFLPLAGDALGMSVATHRPVGEDGYFMLTLSPGRQEGIAQPRDVTVVMDVSGSMSGEKIAQARSALRGLLDTFGEEDRFRLISFSSDVRRFSEDWSRASGSELGRARRWVDGLVADGGTNIAGALDEAFRLESPEERLPVVIFLTDGLPSVGEQSPERLADRAERMAGRARVFAFGVGHDVNTHLLDRLSEAARGSTDYVEPGENVERAISLLATKVRHPVLTDVEIDDVPVRWTEIYPVRIPDVFAGEELILFGRYQGDADGRVTVRGSRGGRTVAFETDAVFPRSTEANGYLPRLWASRKLGHLMRQIWTEGETQSLRDEIRTLALRYGLPSPYTSYLVTEPDVVAQRVGGLRDDPARRMQNMPAAAPAAASGASAVRRAEEARQFRSAKSMERLFEMEEAMADAVADADAEMPRRMLAGRLFGLEDGVWNDLGHRDKVEIVRVQAYGQTYFRLLDELPELRPILRALTPVLVAGGDVSVQIGEEGVDEMTDQQLRELVSRFREIAKTP